MLCLRCVPHPRPQCARLHITCGVGCTRVLNQLNCSSACVCVWSVFVVDTIMSTAVGNNTGPERTGVSWLDSPQTVTLLRVCALVKKCAVLPLVRLNKVPLANLIGTKQHRGIVCVCAHGLPLSVAPRPGVQRCVRPGPRAEDTGR